MVTRAVSNIDFVLAACLLGTCSGIPSNSHQDDVKWASYKKVKRVLVPVGDGCEMDMLVKIKATPPGTPFRATISGHRTLA